MTAKVRLAVAPAGFWGRVHPLVRVERVPWIMATKAECRRALESRIARNKPGRRRIARVRPVVCGEEF